MRFCRNMFWAISHTNMSLVRLSWHYANPQWIEIKEHRLSIQEIRLMCPRVMPLAAVAELHPEEKDPQSVLPSPVGQKTSHFFRTKISRKTQNNIFL